jgi:hypothetical protein
MTYNYTKDLLQIKVVWPPNTGYSWILTNRTLTIVANNIPPGVSGKNWAQ